MRVRTALPVACVLLLGLAGCSAHPPRTLGSASSPVRTAATAPITTSPTISPGSASTSTATTPVSPSSASTVPTPTTTSAPAIDPDPLSGLSFWVNPASPAAIEVQHRSETGDTADAAALRAISDQPTARWLGSWSALDAVPGVLSDARRSGTTPVFVAYFIPNRDCGGQSSGGANSDSKYRDWIGSLSAKLGTSSAVVILEPDAIPMAAPGGCANGEYHHRTGLLQAAVVKLKAHPGVRVYLDAGHPAWPSDPTLSVQPLLDSGLAQADGFALNTSNFQSTADDLAYGNALSQLVGGKHFVIDTGRNGNGPLPDHSGYRGPVWCNPPGRALGPAPTTNTGDPQADAFLWIKYPGQSDGDCGLKDPPAGTWLPDYALSLIHNRH